MRRRLAFAFLVALFVGGAVLWERVLSTPVRAVFVVLDESARAPRWGQLAWTIELDGRMIARGVVNARDGSLPAHELLGDVPLKRGTYLLRAGFVPAALKGEAPPLERRVTFDVDDEPTLLVPIEGDVP